MSLTTSTVLVTGASRGLGRAVALALGARGATVAVHHRASAAAADAVVAGVVERGGRAVAVTGDLADPAGPAAIVGSAREALVAAGVEPVLHGLVLCAGEMVPGGLEELSADAMDRAFAVNVRAQVLLVAAALPLVPRGGRIVTVSAAIGRRATPDVLIQSAAKVALQDVSRGLAAALGPRGIGVVDVAPGVTRTDLTTGMLATPGVEEQVAAATALGRIGEPEDLADAIVALLSPSMRWVTGQTVEVSGGLWL